MKTFSITLLCLLVSLFTGFSAYAMKLDSRLIENKNGELEKVAHFECSAQESFCQNLCGNLVSCEVPEYLCMDCVSFQNPDLRSLVTDMALLFRPEQGVVPEEQLVRFFSSQKFMLIESNLFLNVFNRQKAQEIKEAYNSFCPTKSENPMIIAKISNSMELEKFVGVICDGPSEQSFAVALKSNPEYIAESKAYFDSVTQILAQEKIQLQLDKELKPATKSKKSKTKAKKVAKSTSPELSLKLSLTMD